MHVPQALVDNVVISHNVTIVAYDKSRTVYIDEFFRRRRCFGSCHIRFSRSSRDGRLRRSN